MSDSHGASDPQWYAGMVLAILVTLIVAVVALRSAPRAEFWTGREAYLALAEARRADPGVRATLSAGAVVLEQRFPALRFRLDRGERLDPALPAGPFRGVFAVTFDPGPVREAFIGAEFQGGSVIVRRGGTVLLADATGDERHRAMSTLPIGVGPGRETIVYEFVTAGGDAATALHALWQPMGSTTPAPAPRRAGAVAAARRTR